MMKSELKKEKWFCKTSHIVNEDSFQTQTYFWNRILLLLFVYRWRHHRETCLIYVLNHLMPEKVLYSLKVSRKIRVETAYTIICSSPRPQYVSHLGKLRPRERQALTQSHRVSGRGRMEFLISAWGLSRLFSGSLKRWASGTLPAVHHCIIHALRHQQAQALLASGCSGTDLPKSTLSNLHQEP